ncbi:acyltransferase domain-containing protein [Micromonospora sp. BRA006-A]|nr:acyltransferase domain-containing protein [Micromonospora sp. BRA006-A]
MVALRSRIIAGIAGDGGMVSVATTADEATATIARWAGRIALAAVNGPTSVVVSGDGVALDELVAHYESREVRVRRVPVDYASHSAHVEQLREQLLELLAGLRPRTGEVRFRSTVEGTGSTPLPSTPTTGTATCGRPSASTRRYAASSPPATRPSSRSAPTPC